MSGPNHTIVEAQESLARYERKTDYYEEHWKQDHQEAMRCFDFEEVLAFGLSLYDYLNRIDEAWRAKVHRQLISYDAEFDRLIEELYRLWLKPCDRILNRLTSFEKHFEVEGAKEFRAACREVKGLLTPDEEFFSQDRLVRLRDEAVAANLRGDVEEMKGVAD